MAEKAYSCAELAALKLPTYPTTKKGWYQTVKRENWGCEVVHGKGGRGGVLRRYTPPPAIQKLIAQRQTVVAEGAAARTAQAILAAARAEQAASLSAKTSAAVDDIRAQLSLKGLAKFDAKFELVLAWRNYCGAHPEIKRNASFHAFAEAYRSKHLSLPEAVRKAYPRLSARSVQRWVLDNEKRGLVVMADARTRKGGGTSQIEANPFLEKLILAILTEKPHVMHIHVHDILKARRIDPETGEVLWPEVSYSALTRYIGRWKAQNAQAHLLATNPDAWKSKHLSSLGRLDGDIVRLNQRWEMDGTPADWDLIGGRHTASVVIDVWTRRIKILFSKTPRTETNKALLRAAVLDWGVPEQVKTDNGSDYVSREMALFFEELGIQGVQSNKFSPWEKAHVERVIKTYLHSILELLDNFVGHDVAERKAINARQTFAEQLFQKNAVIKVDMTVDQLQEITNNWVSGIYMVDTHSTLGMSPLARAASWTGPVRRVENERSLDILLFKPVSREPIISAKGIRYDKAWFIHPELPLHAGKQADIRLDPTDIGRLVVRVDGRFLCIAECPERTGINQAEVAAKGRALQREWAKRERAIALDRRKGLPTTHEMVKQIVLDRAQAAGKVALLPKPVQPHDSPGLREAAKAASRIDGEFSRISPDASVVTAVAGAAEVAPAAPKKVHVIPETAELRYRKWRDLADRFEKGVDIPEFEIEQVRRFFQTWPESAEGKALRRRYEAPKNDKGNPAATGLPSLIR